MMSRTMGAILLAVALSASLAGCARKASPTAPPGAFYPRQYPDISGVPASADQTTTPVDGRDEGGDVEVPVVQEKNRAVFDGLRHPEASSAP